MQYILEPRVLREIDFRTELKRIQHFRSMPEPYAESDEDPKPVNEVTVIGLHWYTKCLDCELAACGNDASAKSFQITHLKRKMCL